MTWKFAEISRTVIDEITFENNGLIEVLILVLIIPCNPRDLHKCLLWVIFARSIVCIIT